MNEYEALVEWCRQVKPDVLGRNLLHSHVARYRSRRLFWDQNIGLRSEKVIIALGFTTCFVL
jgi:hypothetical protein